MAQLALKFPGAGGIDISEDLKVLGPSRVTGGWQQFILATPADIVNFLMPFIFTIAGLILFVMLVFGGFTIFTSAGNDEKINKGKAMITNAIIGFVIIFAAYWIIQILEITLGVNIL